LPALKSVGITHAALANNHTCDQGREGIESTFINLTANGIIPLGAGCNETKACDPIFVNKGKIKVALFNSVLVPLENWMYLSDSYGICQSSVDELCGKIQNTKMVEKKCHVVIILHWGAEYATDPMPEQRYYARKLIDAGADVIIGHHPHVIQPTEIYKDKHIFYSLGNFVFDAKREIANIGILASLTFKENEITATEYRYRIKQCVPGINEK
jgi:poly-gamma-glutamate synthesis protein (capsule biosynthesis protein)